MKVDLNQRQKLPGSMGHICVKILENPKGVGKIKKNIQRETSLGYFSNYRHDDQLMYFR